MWQERDGNYNKYNDTIRATENSGWRYPVSVQTFARDEEGRKPLALMQYLVRTYTVPGALVLDHCMGPYGTTGLACLRTGRRFIGMDSDPLAFHSAVRHITSFQSARSIGRVSMGFVIRSHRNKDIRLSLYERSNLCPRAAGLFLPSESESIEL